jgi:hypothetical protein
MYLTLLPRRSMSEMTVNVPNVIPIMSRDRRFSAARIFRSASRLTSLRGRLTRSRLKHPQDFVLPFFRLESNTWRSFPQSHMHSQVPGESIRTAVSLENRCPVTSIDGRGISDPLERKKPHATRDRTNGCSGFIDRPEPEQIRVVSKSVRAMNVVRVAGRLARPSLHVNRGSVHFK